MPAHIQILPCELTSKQPPDTQSNGNTALEIDNNVLDALSVAPEATFISKLLPRQLMQFEGMELTARQQGGRKKISSTGEIL